MLRFPFNEKKALEALVLIARAWPGVTAFYAAKVLFFAEKWHLNQFGRPVIGDRFIAMENGPVPSNIYDWFKGKIDLMGDPEGLLSAVEFNRDGRYVKARSLREPDFDYLSQTEMEALQRSIDFCRSNSFSELSQATHREAAYRAASLNAEMDPLLLIDEGEHKEEKAEAVQEFALYGTG